MGAASYGVLAITEGAGVVSLRHSYVYQVAKVNLERICAALFAVVRVEFGELMH